MEPLSWFLFTLGSVVWSTSPVVSQSVSLRVWGNRRQRIHGSKWTTSHSSVHGWRRWFGMQVVQLWLRQARRRPLVQKTTKSPRLQVGMVHVGMEILMISRTWKFINKLYLFLGATNPSITANHQGKENAHIVICHGLIKQVHLGVEGVKWINR